jgi:hypothetical protein
VIRTKGYFVVVLLAAVVLGISACSLVVQRDRTASPVFGARHAGPPPDAPGPGYRYAQPDGVELVFDSNLGAYLVSGHADHYYHHGEYYRWNSGSWEQSPKVSDGWRPASEKKVPRGLRKAHEHGKGK